VGSSQSITGYVVDAERIEDKSKEGQAKKQNLKQSTPDEYKLSQETQNPERTKAISCDAEIKGLFPGTGNAPCLMMYGINAVPLHLSFR
jgi:hypothetical protein